MNKIATSCLVIAGMISGCVAQEPVCNRLIVNKVGIRHCYEQKLDSIVDDAIAKRAMPGCSIIAAKDGYVVFNKNYGYLDYDSIVPVTDSTLYDLASVTKLVASSLMMMHLYEDELIDLDKPLTYYFPEIADNGATLRDALAHQAGFKPWLDLRRRHKDLAKALVDSSYYDVVSARSAIRQTVLSEPLNEKGNYQYSDLGFILYPQFAEKFFNIRFEKYLESRFYIPLGVSPTFNPLRKHPRWNIAPTEKDSIWRKTVVRGNVHDEGAALLGGVSGHAGLFANAMDMAVIMQMLLNKGEYNGVRFLCPETVELFTSQAFEGNRRGLVFDKPLLDPELNGTPSKKASKDSFGHTGFTGTFVWADPKNNLLLVFLCNSTYPNRGVMLSRLNVRTQVHDVFYEEDLIED